MKYKKEHIKSDGRRLIGGGPRDLQRRQQQTETVIDHSDVIREFKDEVNRLSEELKERPVIDGFSGEQMDNEIRAAVTEAVSELKKELKDYHKKEEQLIKELKEKDNLLEKIKDKYNKEIKNLMKEHSEKLEKLTTSFIESTAQNKNTEDDYIENDRPKIKAEFIDPLEEDAGITLEPFLDIKGSSTNDQENMFGKIDKLKGILGKLPSK